MRGNDASRTNGGHAGGNCPIGIHDDFLGLGGDSLAAMRCINRIIATFSVEVPLDLFLIESATIAQVASEIARIRPNTGQLAERANA